MQHVEAAIGEADDLALHAADAGIAFGLFRRQHDRRTLAVAAGSFVLKRHHQFVRRDRGRAALADDDTGRGIGQVGGFLHGQAAGDGGRQGGDRRVAGADDVEDFAGAGRNMHGRTVARYQGHALFAACDEHGVGAAGGQAQAPGLFRLFVRVRIDAAGFLGFLGVGRDDGGVTVIGEIVRLGIDDHRRVKLTGNGDGFARHGVGQQALGIVRQDQHVVVRQLFGDDLENGLFRCLR